MSSQSAVRHPCIAPVWSFFRGAPSNTINLNKSIICKSGWIQQSRHVGGFGIWMVGSVFSERHFYVVFLSNLDGKSYPAVRIRFYPKRAPTSPVYYYVITPPGDTALARRNYLDIQSPKTEFVSYEACSLSDVAPWNAICFQIELPPFPSSSRYRIKHTGLHSRVNKTYEHTSCFTNQSNCKYIFQSPRHSTTS